MCVWGARCGEGHSPGPGLEAALLVHRALADMNNDGRMDQVEFSIAMKLIKLKLQGYQLPSALPPVMKQQLGAVASAPAFGECEQLPVQFTKTRFPPPCSLWHRALQSRR